MIINVTQKHIDNGKRVSCRSCPVALALAEQTGITYDIFYFGNGKLMVATHDDAPYYLLPINVNEWIREYDQGAKMLPFSFDFEQTPFYK